MLSQNLWGKKWSEVSKRIHDYMYLRFCTIIEIKTLPHHTVLGIRYTVWCNEGCLLWCENDCVLDDGVAVELINACRHLITGFQSRIWRTQFIILYMLVRTVIIEVQIGWNLSKFDWYWFRMLTPNPLCDPNLNHFHPNLYLDNYIPF